MRQRQPLSKKKLEKAVVVRAWLYFLYKISEDYFTQHQRDSIRCKEDIKCYQGYDNKSILDKMVDWQLEISTEKKTLMCQKLKVTYHYTWEEIPSEDKVGDITYLKPDEDDEYDEYDEAPFTDAAKTLFETLNLQISKSPPSESKPQGSSLENITQDEHGDAEKEVLYAKVQTPNSSRRRSRHSGEDEKPVMPQKTMPKARQVLPAKEASGGYWRVGLEVAFFSVVFLGQLTSLMFYHGLKDWSWHSLTTMVPLSQILTTVLIGYFFWYVMRSVVAYNKGQIRFWGVLKKTVVFILIRLLVYMYVHCWHLPAQLPIISLVGIGLLIWLVFGISHLNPIPSDARSARTTSEGERSTSSKAFTRDKIKDLSNLDEQKEEDRSGVTPDRNAKAAPGSRNHF